MPAIIDKVKELLHLNKTVFDDTKVTVVFVLGGPGVGARPCFQLFDPGSLMHSIYQERVPSVLV